MARRGTLHVAHHTSGIGPLVTGTATLRATEVDTVQFDIRTARPPPRHGHPSRTPVVTSVVVPYICIYHRRAVAPGRAELFLKSGINQHIIFGTPQHGSPELFKRAEQSSRYTS